jgi:hypothetical protein
VKNTKKPAKPAKVTESRRARKPVGHEDGKRVAALRTRVTTLPSNGDHPSSMEVAPEPKPIAQAMREAVDALGDVQIDPDLAPSQLRQLSDAYENVTKAKAAFNAKNDDAKVAKKALESATDFLLERVKAFTHPAALPLFDTKQAESDEAAMVAGDDAPLDPGMDWTPAPEGAQA